MIEEGKTLDEIAVIRGRRRSTIVSMVSDLVERGLLEFQDSWVAEDRQRQIEAAAANLGLERFSPIKEALPEDFTYDEIRLVVANLRRRRERRPIHGCGDVICRPVTQQDQAREGASEAAASVRLFRA